MGFSAAIFALTLLIPPASAWVLPAGQGFSLVISTMQESVRIGSEIKLTIKLTNETNHVISLMTWIKGVTTQSKFATAEASSPGKRSKDVDLSALSQ